MMILVIALSGMAHATIVSVQYGAWPYGSAGWPEHYLSLGNGGGYVEKTTETLLSGNTVPLFDPSWGTLMQVGVQINGYASIGGGYASKWGSGDYVQWSHNLISTVGDMVFSVNGTASDFGTIPDWK